MELISRVLERMFFPLAGLVILLAVLISDPHDEEDDDEP